MSPEDYGQTLRSLESHSQEFLRISQDAQNFFPDDRLQVQREYSACTQKYELLLRSLEKGKAVAGGGRGGVSGGGGLGSSCRESREVFGFACTEGPSGPWSQPPPPALWLLLCFPAVL